jgi:imidazolonepropionase-like amidohydrolase
MMDPEAKKQQWKVMVDNLGRYYRAGGKIVIGTDLMHSRDFRKDAVIPVPELRALAQAGLPLQEVVKAGTISAAEVVGTGAEEGLLQEGRLANLIAVTGRVDESFAALERDNIGLVLHYGTVIRKAL